MNWKLWLAIVEEVAPIILLATPAEPFDPLIIAGIKIAQQIPGATGPQKKAIVQQLVAVGATAANTAAGKPMLDPQATVDSAGPVIDAIVGITNLVHQARQATPAAA